MLRSLQNFLKTESNAGIALLCMVSIALLWANGPAHSTYESWWTTTVGAFGFNLDLRHWVNDALMALFFFVVGLEVKREFIDGELRDRRRAMTPVLAAIGGMVVPAAVYFAFNSSGEGSSGWGIPMATDIAIVLGVLALAGDRVPPALKTFLLTLAVVDDIGAIAVIAVFYTEHSVNAGALAIVSLLLAFTWLLGRLRLLQSGIFAVLAVAVWFATYETGVHASIAGVALAFVTPSGSLKRIQERLHPWTSYAVLPLFALANTGIHLTAHSLDRAFSSPVALGIFVALVVGKPLGICMATAIAVRSGGSLPRNVRFSGIVAVSILAGIGFTVSLFVGELAFENTLTTDDAKVGVFAASIISAIAGIVSLRVTLRKPT